MYANLNISRLPWTKILFLLALLSLVLSVASGRLIEREPYLVTAATIDLLFTVPLVYWLVIRRSSIPKITVLTVFFAMAGLAALVLPSDERWFFETVVLYGIPVVELVGIGYVLIQANRVRGSYRRTENSGHDMPERLRDAFEEHIRPTALGRALAFEIGLIGLLIFTWRQPSSESHFTYHRRNGALPLLTLFLFVVIVEAVVLHVILSRWSMTAAWIVTAVSGYFSLQLIAHLKAVVLRPIFLSDERLFFRCGILGDSSIARSNIEGVQIITEAAAGAITPLAALSAPNIRLVLRDECNLYGVYGIKRRAGALEIYVDDPGLFAEAVR